MGLPHPKLLILSHLAFLLVSSSAQLPPAAAPSYHHHHHHVHNPHHHPAPTYAPTKSPVPPPAYPPVKPPAHSPVKPPVHPPVKPPTKPPVKPPTKPPTHPPDKPPAHSPVKPPTHPPVKPPAHPPVKPPTKPPVKPPAHPPVKPPTYPPVKPPTTPPVKPPTPYKPLAVQGVVYCKNCSYSGVDTLLGSMPLSGATVVLKCRTLKSVVMKNATTDKNGYFFIEAPKGVISNLATKYCHVYLGASEAGAKCKRPTNLNGGRLGGLLKSQETLAPLPYALYNVGPFAYEPPKRHCRKPTSSEAAVQPQLAH